MPRKFTVLRMFSEASTSHFGQRGLDLDLGIQVISTFQRSKHRECRNEICLEGWHVKTKYFYNYKSWFYNQHPAKSSGWQARTRKVFSPIPSKSSDQPCNSCQQRVLWLSIPFLELENFSQLSTMLLIKVKSTPNEFSRVFFRSSPSSFALEVNWISLH